MRYCVVSWVRGFGQRRRNDLSLIMSAALTGHAARASPTGQNLDSGPVGKPEQDRHRSQHSEGSQHVPHWCLGSVWASEGLMLHTRRATGDTAPGLARRE